MKAKALAATALLLSLSGCDLAPAYKPPQFQLPAHYKVTAGFGPAQPANGVSRAAWWEAFQNPELDALMAQALKNSPSLGEAAARYAEARDMAAEQFAGGLPHLGAGAGVTDNKESIRQLWRNNFSTPSIESSNHIDLAASWEPDFWDSLRNSTWAKEADAQGMAAAEADAALSLEAELAVEYIILREYDQELAVYDKSIASYQKALGLTKQRLAGDLASGLDVDRAEDQLATAQTRETDTRIDRAKAENAIAVLVGTPAMAFSLPPQGDTPMALPAVPSQVPSSILQRRPDIAQAERRMAAANDAIGVARAAFYPNGVISAAAGFEDDGLDLYSLPNSIWSVGAAIAMPLFDGGLNDARLAQTWAAYAEAREQYRGTVLSAFKDVEDALVLSADLQDEADQASRSATAAGSSAKLSLILYRDGLSDYLGVVVSQQDALKAQLTVADVSARRLAASVALVRALGGGWSAATMPSMRQARRINPTGPQALSGITASG